MRTLINKYIKILISHLLNTNKMSPTCKRKSMIFQFLFDLDQRHSYSTHFYA